MRSRGLCQASLVQIRKVALTGAGLEIVVPVGQGSRLSREWAGLMTFPDVFCWLEPTGGRRNDGPWHVRCATDSSLPTLGREHVVRIQNRHGGITIVT